MSAVVNINACLDYSCIKVDICFGYSKRSICMHPYGLGFIHKTVDFGVATSDPASRGFYFVTHRRGESNLYNLNIKFNAVIVVLTI